MGRGVGREGKTVRAHLTLPSVGAGSPHALSSCILTTLPPSINIPILQIKKLKLKEVRQIIQVI